MIPDVQIFIQSNTLLPKTLDKTDFNQPQIPVCSMLYGSPASVTHWTQQNST